SVQQHLALAVRDAAEQTHVAVLPGRCDGLVEVAALVGELGPRGWAFELRCLRGGAGCDGSCQGGGDDGLHERSLQLSAGNTAETGTLDVTRPSGRSPCAVLRCILLDIKKAMTLIIATRRPA